MLALALLMNHNFNKSEKQLNAHLSAAQIKLAAQHQQQNLLTHAFFIENAQKFITQNEWSKAVTILKDALEMLPDNFETNYLLAIALVNQCKATSVDCEIANQHLYKLITANPDKITLQLQFPVSI